MSSSDSSSSQAPIVATFSENSVIAHYIPETNSYTFENLSLNFNSNLTAEWRELLQAAGRMRLEINLPVIIQSTAAGENGENMTTATDMILPLSLDCEWNHDRLQILNTTVINPVSGSTHGAPI